MDSKKDNNHYQEALDWLFRQLPMFSRVGAPAYKPGLETSISLSAFFKNPHTKFKSIHVGGTNGKGSTSNMLASVLQEHGLKTGLYTSPHLVDFKERMKIDGKMIPRENVVEFVERWKRSGYSGHPSFFELTMIMAFEWFASEKVDIAVIEVGMGGRLDSTNIISPELSVITNISKDHTQFLGDTLEKIATEKAGIIKPGVPVVIGERINGNVDKVFINRAEAQGSPLFFAEDICGIESFLEIPNKGWSFNIKGENFYVPLPGVYQPKNITTTFAALEILNRENFNITIREIRNGLEKLKENTGLEGRWTVIREKPLVICDTGHNYAGMEYNMSQLRHLQKNLPGGKLKIIIGFVADKAIDEILGLLPRDAFYYVSNAKIPRALPSTELKVKFDKLNLKNKNIPDVGEAFREALDEADQNDIIFVGGSTFIVADLLSYLRYTTNI